MIVHSFSTVRFETPRTSATSSTVRPPKNRSSTIRAWRASVAGQFIDRLVHGQHVGVMVRRDHQLFVERDAVPASAALGPMAGAGVVHQDPPHGLCADGEKMRAALAS